jgi:ABC-type sugar transport system ATPase subunit
MAFMTEDRKLTGLNLIATVLENTTMVALKKYSPKFWIQKKKEIAACEEMVKKLRIKTPSIRQIVNNLSGGNQQKVVIAKWLLQDSDILIMDEPTRGIDIGAKDEIYTNIKNLSKEGKTIVLISSELQEVINLSDRVIVFNSGYIAGELTGEEINTERIFRLSAKNIGTEGTANV